MKLPIFALAVFIAAPVAVFAQDLKESYDALTTAEAQKDTALIKKAAAEAHAVATETIKSAPPATVEEKKNWQARVDYAKEVATHAEYAVFALAVEAPAAGQVELFAALEEMNPKSTYLDDGYARYFYALNQTGASAKVIPLAEKALTNFPENEDILLVLADNALNKKQVDRALTLANKLVAAMNKHAKPEGIAAADWEKKKTAALGRGYWMAGVIYGEKQQYMNADKSLRAALPLIQGNITMTSPALYYLGVANYNLGKMTLNKAKVLEGAKFSEQAAAIQGPLQQQAWKNAQIMKTEAGQMR
jgi:hypothetical protein